MAIFDKRTARALATILLFLSAAAFIYGARKVLILFLMAIFFAYLLEPLVAWMERRTRISRESRTLAIFEVYVVLGAALSLLALLVGPKIVNEGRTFAGALPGLFSKVSTGQIAVEIGTKRGWSYETQFRIQQFLSDHSATILAWVNSLDSWLARFAENLIWFLLIPILAIFFLKDGRKFALDLLSMVSRREQKFLLAGIEVELHEMVARYIRSQIILAGLSLVAYIAVLSLLRVPYSLVLGWCAGMLEFIPIVGPAVAAAGILGVSFLSNYHHLLWVALFLLVWRLTQDYFTSPHLMSSRLRLHPLEVIFAVLVGGELGGVIGAYLSIPVAAALRIVWRRWQRTYESSNIRAA